MKKENKRKFRIYVNQNHDRWFSQMKKDVDEFVEKNKKRKINKSDIYLNMLKPRYIDLRDRGFFKNGDKTIDDFINQEEQHKQISYDLDLYSRVARINEFDEKGIDGETNIRKILETKSDCLPNGEKDVLKIYRTCQWIVRQIESDTSLKRYLIDLDKEIKLEHDYELDRLRREQVAKYKNSLI